MTTPGQGIYLARWVNAAYMTLVVRAGSEAEAQAVAARAGARHLDWTPLVDVEYVDPSGPAGVIVQEPS